MDILVLPIGVVVIALLATGARLSMSDARITLKEAVSSLIVAVFMAVASYPYLLEIEIGDGQRIMAIAGLTFMAKDILSIVLALQRQIKKDPLGVLRDYLNWRKPKDD